jgi:plastocyanin
MSRRALILACLTALTVARCADSPVQPPAAPANAIPAGTVVGTASIEGRVTYAGTAPVPETLRTDSDAACRHKQEGPVVRESLVVGPEGGLTHAYVHVVSGLGDRVFAAPQEPVTLDQRGCTYRPHVVGVQVGQPLRVLNSDPTLHNVHAVPKANAEFNFGQSKKGMETIRTFDKSEVMVPFRCDVHGWMNAYAGVVAHPYYAVSQPDGTFEIKGLPAGTYTIEAWHERFGTQTTKVTVDGKSGAMASFAFKG